MTLPDRIARLETRRAAERANAAHKSLDALSVPDLRFMEIAITKMVEVSGREFGWSDHELVDVLGAIDGPRLGDLIRAAFGAGS